MSNNEKVYVIDSSKRLKARGKRSALKRSDEPATDEAAPVAGARPSPVEPPARLDRLEEKGSSALAFLSFLAGPFSILATRRGRQSAIWIWLAATSTTLVAVLVGLRAGGIFPSARQDFDTQSFIWLLAVCAAALMGFSAWARGVALTGRIKAPLLRRLPEIVRHPAAVGVFGFLVPGFGLHVAGAPKRAAGALWMVSLLVVPFAVLRHAPALWRWNFGMAKATK